jgi:Asp-tRNA(Asn)/Glu-tRNA(Gln) amidotransferase A subunit family amidase
VLTEIKNFEARGLNIFVEVREDDVLAQARASDARHKRGEALGVFDGVMVAVKVMLVCVLLCFALSCFCFC